MPAPPAQSKAKNFQDLILTLQQFWAEKGCLILQPYDNEMGAGTFHPATTLRALGPHPWKAAYVQPSRRPKDGRYGENPNRLQHYYQFQVILKPAPENVQELYLESLAAIGIVVAFRTAGSTEIPGCSNIFQKAAIPWNTAQQERKSPRLARERITLGR